MELVSYLFVLVSCMAFLTLQGSDWVVKIEGESRGGAMRYLEEVGIGWVLVGRGEPLEWYEAGADGSEEGTKVEELVAV
jgi:hypothetical protein